MSIFIKGNSKVLFQGDSITDAGRDKENLNDLGRGYPMMVSSWFSALHPEKKVEFYNRGISGNRVKDLKSRWKEDCLDLKPDVLSILIGINDCWRRYDSNDETTTQKYEDDYRYILSQVKEQLPKTKIIICEPFVLPFPKDREAWREDLDPKIQVARKLSIEFQTAYIPLDGIFAQASTLAPHEYWAADGVHPTLPGHALISQKWLDIVKA